MVEFKPKKKSQISKQKKTSQDSGVSGCKIKAFGTAYYSIPCGLITTVFSLTLSNLVSVPNLEEGERHFFPFFFQIMPPLLN